MSFKLFKRLCILSISLLAYGHVRAAEPVLQHQQPSFLERHWITMLLYWHAIDAQCWDIKKELVAVKTVKKGNSFVKEHTYKETPYFNYKKVPATVARMLVFDKIYSQFRKPISLVYAPFKWTAETVLGYKYGTPEYYKAGWLSTATPLVIILDFIKNGVIRSSVHRALSGAFAHVEKAVFASKAYATAKNAVVNAAAKVGVAYRSLTGNTVVAHNNVQNKTAQQGSKKTPYRSKVVVKPPVRNAVRPNNTHAKKPHSFKA